jgi:hypothetical protein
MIRAYIWKSEKDEVGRPAINSDDGRAGEGVKPCVACSRIISYMEVCENTEK